MYPVENRSCLHAIQRDPKPVCVVDVLVTPLVQVPLHKRLPSIVLPGNENKTGACTLPAHKSISLRYGPAVTLLALFSNATENKATQNTRELVHVLIHVQQKKIKTSASENTCSHDATPLRQCVLSRRQDADDTRKRKRGLCRSMCC